MAPGIGYAFFDCRASIDTVDACVRDVQRRAPTGTLDALTLEVRDVSDLTTNEIVEPGSDDLFQQAYDCGWRYVVKATASDRKGQVVAADLGLLINSIYSPPLFEKDEKLIAHIAYGNGDGHFDIYQE